MTKKQFDLAMTAINNAKNESIEKLYTQYSKENNPYEIGDIIEDHCHIMKIEKIVFRSTYQGRPECAYFGTRFKKDLKPFKSGEKSSMWQSNVKRKIKEGGK